VSILEVDMFSPPDPERIRLRSFARVRKGYDPEQVHEYLGRVAETVQGLLEEVDELRERAVAGEGGGEAGTGHEAVPGGVSAETKDPYAELAQRMADVLRTAELHAERVRTEGEQQIQKMLEEARSEAAQLRQTAVEDAERTRKRAEEDAEGIRGSAAEALDTAKAETEPILTGLAERRHHLVSELQSTRERLVTIVEQLQEAAEQEVPAPEALIPEAEELPPAPPLPQMAESGDELAGAWPERSSETDPRILWQRDPFAPLDQPGRDVQDESRPGRQPNGRADPDGPPTNSSWRHDPDERHADEMLGGAGTINLILPDIPSFDEDPGEGRR
jgi:DivIVA domain-containing protein